MPNGTVHFPNTDTMTRGAFYFVLGSLLAWGFVLTSIVSRSTANWEMGLGGLFVVGLGIPLLGIFLSAAGNTFIKFVGFHLVVGGIAAILGPLFTQIASIEPGLIERAATLTALVTGVMAVSGLLFPSFYASIGGALFGALIALVVVSFARIFIPAIQDAGVIDYISAIIFSLYIGYDMHRANTMPATLGNVMEVAVSLYLDIMNLFLDILRILGSGSDSSDSGSSSSDGGSDGGGGGD